MAGKKRRRDDALARYYAYRIAVWKTEHPGAPQAELARMFGFEPPIVTDLASGNNGSHQRVAAVARVLGPPSEDDFKQLAKDWAEAYPTWKAEDPLPERITHTGDPLEQAHEGGSDVYSEDFRVAARHLVGLAQCSPDQARAAATLAWEQNRGLETERDWHWWLGQMRDKLAQIKAGSGERPSSKIQLVK